MTRCPESGKRCYTSPRAAKWACRKVGNRFRIYRCKSCGSLHITKRVGK